MGWTVGFEPTNTRATTWRLRPLGDAHHGGRFARRGIQPHIAHPQRITDRCLLGIGDAIDVSGDVLNEERSEAEEEEKAEHVGGGGDEDAGGQRWVGADSSEHDWDEETE